MEKAKAVSCDDRAQTSVGLHQCILIEVDGPAMWVEEDTF